VLGCQLRFYIQEDCHFDDSKLMDQLIQHSESEFIWRDVTAPSKEELHALSDQYDLHSLYMEDCLDPGHLPKYENVEGKLFVILRTWNNDGPAEVDTITSLTTKVALFTGKQFFLSVHRKQLTVIQDVQQKWIGTEESPESVLFARIAEKVLDSFRPPLEKLTFDMEKLESRIFLGKKHNDLLARFYALRRRIWLMKRLVWMNKEVLERYQIHEPINPGLQECMDTATDLLFLLDDIMESTSNLTSLHLALESHRTNEVMRVLTIFSVFFLPLTFIVGIYGMNFEHMPELKWYYGYPMAIASMGIITVSIAAWFRHRGWMK
jgi:magnesium transporter